MLAMKLSRIGKKKAPIFRIVVIEKGRDPWAKALEILGTVDRRAKQIILKEDRIKYWLSVGAQPSASVANILIDHKLLEGKKRSVSTMTGKRKGKLEEKAAAAAEAKAEAQQAAKEKAEAEAAAKAEEEAKAAEATEGEAPAESDTGDTPAEADTSTQETDETQATEETSEEAGE